jgi:hypothetical protein
MSSPLHPQMGGLRYTAMDEIQTMMGHFLLIGLILTCVYVSRIPRDVLQKFRHSSFQMIGLLIVILITSCYGWIHGTLAALAYALIVSRAIRTINEGLIDFVPPTISFWPSDVEIVPENHRWLGERIMGENPFMIRDKEVKTSAVQDFSEMNMGASTNTR